MSRVLAKYSQHTMAVDFEKIVLTVTPFHSRFPTLATQSIDRPTPDKATKHTGSQTSMAKLFLSLWMVRQL